MLAGDMWGIGDGLMTNVIRNEELNEMGVKEG